MHNESEYTMSIQSIKRLIETNPSHATNVKTKISYTDAIIVNELKRIQAEHGFKYNIWGSQKQFEENKLSVDGLQAFEIKVELNRIVRLYNIGQIDVQQHIADYDEMKALKKAKRDAKQTPKKAMFTQKYESTINELQNEINTLKSANETLKQSNDMFIFMMNALKEKGVA